MGTVKMANNNTTAQSNDRNKRSGRKGRKNLPESVILDRKGRKVGSDDALQAARIAEWSEHEGLRGAQREVALGIAQALKAAVDLALDGQHRDAGKKAASCAYVLKRNERVGKLKVQCRDGRERKLAQVVEWYGNVHFKIADDIEAAQAREAEMAETRKRNAELKRAAAEVIAAAEEKAA